MVPFLMDDVAIAGKVLVHSVSMLAKLELGTLLHRPIFDRYSIL